PVAMTMLATALAGISTSEMTQAQYHRSLAAQHQSRAGDQWAFFQAKRLRGALLQSTADVLQPLTRMLDPADLVEAVHRVTAGLQNAESAAKRLEEKWKSPSPNPAMELADKAKKQAEVAAKLEDRLRQELAKPDVQRAFSFLGTRELPPVQEKKDPDKEL